VFATSICEFATEGALTELTATVFAELFDTTFSAPPQPTDKSAMNNVKLKEIFLIGILI
jgi:hypothetical protein